ncbi:MAG: DNA recombination protein RmuC [Planctomycetes bacterium]|nr:DNA recombination protein RmuC [Planctomycetota bacterium]
MEILWLIVGLAVGGFAGFMFARASLQARLQERERSIEELQRLQAQATEALRDAFKSTGADVLKVASQQLADQAKRQFEDQRKLADQEIAEKQRQIDATVAPLREQLAKNEKLLNDMNAKREGDAKVLGEQLRRIADLQTSASAAAQKLEGALRDNRQRGRWGEVSLRNVVEMSGMAAHVDFTEQGTVEVEGGRLRPDMTVNLPGGRQIPIDSKVPLNAYFDSIDPATPESERARRRGDHVAAVRSHVRALGSRAYAKAIESEIDLTIMFIPVESALVSALEADGSLYAEALDAGVVITTPSTLLALLRTCALQWQQAALAENARQIGERAGELLDRIVKFAEHLQAVGKGLETAVKGYNQAVGSFNTRLLPGARATAELTHRQDAAPSEVKAVDSALRGDIAEPLV